jgi:hypothetical protein
MRRRIFQPRIKSLLPSVGTPGICALKNLSLARFSTKESALLVAARIVTERDVDYASSLTAEFQAERTDDAFRPRTPITHVTAPEKPSFQLQGQHQAYYRAAQAAIADQRRRYPRFTAELNNGLDPQSASRQNPYLAEAIAQRIVD